jgi:hypothetical protein
MLCDPIEVDLRETRRRQLAPFDPSRQVGHRGERDVRVALRYATWVGAASHEAVVLRATGEPRKDRIPCRRRSDGVADLHLPRSHAPFHQRRHRRAPRLRRHVTLGTGHRDFDELFSLLERLRRHLGAGALCGVEGRRCARRRILRLRRRIVEVARTCGSGAEEAERRLDEKLSASIHCWRERTTGEPLDGPVNRRGRCSRRRVKMKMPRCAALLNPRDGRGAGRRTA